MPYNNVEKSTSNKKTASRINMNSEHASYKKHSAENDASIKGVKKMKGERKKSKYKDLRSEQRKVLVAKISSRENNWLTETICDEDSKLQDIENYTLNGTVKKNQLVIDGNINEPKDSSDKCLNLKLKFNINNESGIDILPSSADTLNSVESNKRRTYEIDEADSYCFNNSIALNIVDYNKFRFNTNQAIEHDNTDSVLADKPVPCSTNSLDVNQSTHVLSPKQDPKKIAMPTSTPKIISKKTEIKHVSFSEIKKPNNNTTKSSTKSSSKVKMPNYKAIHENMFQKMESIDDYIERKNERAKNLLSNTKTVSFRNKSGSEETQNPKSKQQLTFSTAITTPRKIPILNRPQKPKQSEAQSQCNFSNVAGKSPYKFSTKNENNLPDQIGSVNIVTTSTLQCPIPKVQPKRKSLSTLYREKKRKELEAISTVVKSVSIKKPTKIPIKQITKSSQTKSAEELKTRTSKKAITKSLENQTLKSTNQANSRMQGKLNNAFNQSLKDFANKTRTKTSQIEERRNVIKGVRSNRRFELLMQLRLQQ